MTELEITAAEKEKGALDPERFDAAVSALNEEGIVILKRAVEISHIEALRDRMIADAHLLLERDDCPYNFNTSNIQQDPPPFPPYLFRDILLNDVVIGVTQAILGPGLKNTFYSGNTSVPSDLRQPVHPDTGQLWWDLDAPTRPFGFVVNVPIVDTTPENGATEIWPGSHRDTSTSLFDRDLGRAIGGIPEEALERRRRIAPPLQPSVDAGSVVIRDIRLWHAGTPNRSRVPRPMIAMIHHIRWWGAPHPIVFPKGTESFFDHPDLVTFARFVDEPIDYLSHHQRGKRKKLI